jgi:hypothetical protein
MLRNVVQFGLVLTIAMMSPVPAKAQSSDDIIAQTPDLHPMCLAFAGRPLIKASYSANGVTCFWGNRESGGLAGLNTFSGDALATFRIMQEFQATEFFHANDGLAGFTVEDTSGITDCSEARTIVWKQNGVHYQSLTTAFCDGVGINYATWGAYGAELPAQFAKLVRLKNTPPK